MATQKISPPVVIRLTEPQRQRLKKDTGRDVEEVSIHDDTGKLHHQLPNMSPDEVEQLVMRQGLRDQEASDLDEELAAQAAADDADTTQDDKAAAIAAKAEADALALSEQIEAAFAVEGQAVEAARAAAKKALAAAQAAAKKKKKR